MDNAFYNKEILKKESLVKHEKLQPFMKQLKESGQQALAALAKSEGE